MGLDAYVYRNRARLPFDPSTPGVTIDSSTGVVGFDDPELYRRFADHVVAVHCRLGNLALVNQLHKEAEKSSEDTLPIIRNRVLGNGAHCGDSIRASQLDLLEQEINVLAASTQGSRSVEMDKFLFDMRELVRTARAEGNPIYFG
jgi:hypothetical protein